MSKSKFIAYTALFSVISFILYFWRFPIFPIVPFSELKLDFSELPAMLAGFSINPLAGTIVVVVKTLIKIMFEGLTYGGVGDLSNIIVSLSLILPATIIYHRKKSNKSLIIGMLVAVPISLILSTLSNYYIIVPLAGQFMKILKDESIRVSFAFVYGLGFNAIKCVINIIPMLLLFYQRKILRILGIGRNNANNYKKCRRN